MELNAKFKITPDLKSVNQEIEKLNSKIKSKFKKLNKELSLGKDIVNVKSITKEFDKILKPQRKLQLKIQKISTKDFLDLDKIKTDVRKVLDNVVSKPLKLKVEYDSKLPKTPKILSTIELSEEAAKLLDKLSKPLKIEVSQESGAVTKNTTSEKSDSELAKTASDILKSIQDIGKISDVLDALKNIDISKKNIDFGDIEGLKTSVDNSSKTMSASMDILNNFSKSFASMVPEFKNLDFSKVSPIEIVYSEQPKVEEKQTKFTQVEAPKVSGGLEHLINIQNQMLGVLGNISDKIGGAGKSEVNPQFIETQEKVVKALESLGGKGRGPKQPVNLDRAILKQITAFSNVLAKIRSSKDITKRLDSALSFLSIDKTKEQVAPIKNVIDELKSITSLGKVSDKAMVGIFSTVKQQLKENPTEELRAIVRAFTLAKTTSELGVEKKKEKYFDIAPNNQLTKNIRDIREVAKKQFGAALSGFKKQTKMDGWLSKLNEKVSKMSVVSDKDLKAVQKSLGKVGVGAKKLKEPVPDMKAGDAVKKSIEHMGDNVSGFMKEIPDAFGEVTEKIGKGFDTMVDFFKKGISQFVGGSTEFLRGKETKGKEVKGGELDEIAEDIKKLGNVGKTSGKELDEIKNKFEALSEKTRLSADSTKDLEAHLDTMTGKMGTLGTATHDAGMEIKGSGMVSKLQALQDVASKVSFKTISKGMQGIALGAKVAGSGASLFGRSAKAAGVLGVKAGLMTVSAATKATKGSVKAITEFGGAANKTLSKSADIFQGFGKKSMLNPILGLPRMAAAVADKGLQGAKKFKEHVATPGGIMRGAGKLGMAVGASFGSNLPGLGDIGGIVNMIMEKFKRMGRDYDTMLKAAIPARRLEGGQGDFTGFGSLKLPSIGRTLADWNLNVDEMAQLMQTIGTVQIKFGADLEKALSFADQLTTYGISDFHAAISTMQEYGKELGNIESDYARMISSSKDLNMSTNEWISSVTSGASEVFKYGADINYVDHAYHRIIKDGDRLRSGLNMTTSALKNVAKAMLGVWGTMSEGFAAAVGTMTNSAVAATDPLKAMYKNLGFNVDTMRVVEIKTTDAGTGKTVGGKLTAAKRFSSGEEAAGEIAKTLKDGLASIADWGSGIEAGTANSLKYSREMVAQMFGGNYDTADAVLNALADNSNFLEDVIKGDAKSLKVMKNVQNTAKTERQHLQNIDDKMGVLNDILASAGLSILQTLISIVTTIMMTLLSIGKMLYTLLSDIVGAIVDSFIGLYHSLGDYFGILAIKFEVGMVKLGRFFAGLPLIGSSEKVKEADKELVKLGNSINEIYGDEAEREKKSLAKSIQNAEITGKASENFAVDLSYIGGMGIGVVQNLLAAFTELSKAAGFAGTIIKDFSSVIAAATGEPAKVKEIFKTADFRHLLEGPAGKTTAPALLSFSQSIGADTKVGKGAKEIALSIMESRKRVAEAPESGTQMLAGETKKLGLLMEEVAAKSISILESGLSSLSKGEQGIAEFLQNAFKKAAESAQADILKIETQVTQLSAKYKAKMEENNKDFDNQLTNISQIMSKIDGGVLVLTNSINLASQAIETAKKNNMELAQSWIDMAEAESEAAAKRSSAAGAVAGAMTAARTGTSKRDGGIIGHFASGGLAGYQKQFANLRLDPDGMLAQLHPPEYVVSEKGLRATGLPVLDAINAGRWPQIVEMLQKSGSSQNTTDMSESLKSQRNLDDFFGKMSNVPSFQGGGNLGNGVMYSAGGGPEKMADFAGVGNVGSSGNPGRGGVSVSVDSKPTFNVKVMPDASPQQIEKMKTYMMQRIEDAMGKVYDDFDKTLTSMWTT